MQNADFSGCDFTIRFYKKLYISPYPKICILIYHGYNERQLCSPKGWHIHKFYIFVILDVTAFWKNIIYID